MIQVAGATGQLGGIITRRLLAQGQPVRILVRPQSSFQPLVEAGGQPVFGDLKDRASLDPACEGIETLITTANSARRGGEDNVQTVDLAGNRNLIDAAKAAGVKQFIFTSALGADINSPVPFIQAKAKTEAYLRDSGMMYTILAPNAFMDMWVGMVIGVPLQAGQPVTLVGEGRRKHSFIAVRDVAAFATAAVGHPEAMNQYLAIGGPEALSWRDVVATFERVLDREIPVQYVSPGEPVPALPEGMMQQAMAGMEMYDSPLDMTEAARTFGVELTTLEELVRSQFAGERS